MPIARIRTFDPEAISFLASKLAACGYQLQFASPGETNLEETDLEITVTRMDSGTALQQARLQAEDMGVDVTVVPGVFDFEQSVLAQPPEITHTELRPDPSHVEVVEPALTDRRPAWTTPYHVDETEFGAVESHVAEPDETHPLEPLVESSAQTTNPVLNGMKLGAGAVAGFANSAAVRFSDWRHRLAESRARQQEQRQTLAEDKENIRTAAKPTLVPPLRARTLTRRDRRYRQAAIAAAVVIAAAMIGWSMVGAGGPANPIANSRTANVQQQSPFGAASVSAPQQAIAPVAHQTQPALSVQSVKVSSSKPKPTAHKQTRSARVRRHVARASSGEDDEVVVRHFGTKSVAQQAKAKTKDGVKIITEE